MLKFAYPDGPQFQVSLFPMKKYSCHCRKCGNNFTQNVQKGVDNGIATKILSLAYENICDRFILFAGDGDFYSSLSHVRNVLRKDIWVLGYRGTVSGDLQQLASRVIWMDDLWTQVKGIPTNSNPRERGRRDEPPRNRDAGSAPNMNGFPLPANENEAIGDRQVVIAPSTQNNVPRGRSRGRGGSSNGGRGKGRGRNGRRSRSRSRSRSRDRPRVPPSRGAVTAPPDAYDINAAASAMAIAEMGAPSEESRRPGGENGKKRRRNERRERAHKKRAAGYLNRKRMATEGPVFALSDVSDSEEESDRPFPLALPVPLDQPVAASAILSIGSGTDMGLLGSRDQAINLASDTESE